MNTLPSSTHIPAVFKTCPACGKEWTTRERLLQDPAVEFIGYQVHFKELTSGVFLFNHSCRTTFGIRAGDFRDLYTGDIFTHRAMGTDECPDYCLHTYDLSPCPVECECAYVRDIVQVVNDWPKMNLDSSPSEGTARS